MLVNALPTHPPSSTSSGERPPRGPHRRLQSYGDWSLELPPPPQGTINAHTKISNIFLQDLDIPKPHIEISRSLSSTSIRNSTIAILRVKISEQRESLTNTIDNSPLHSVTCYRSLSEAPHRLLLSISGRAYHYTGSLQLPN